MNRRAGARQAESQDLLWHSGGPGCCGRDTLSVPELLPNRDTPADRPDPGGPNSRILQRCRTSDLRTTQRHARCSLSDWCRTTWGARSAVDHTGAFDDLAEDLAQRRGRNTPRGGGAPCKRRHGADRPGRPVQFAHLRDSAEGRKHRHRVVGRGQRPGASSLALRGAGAARWRSRSRNHCPHGGGRRLAKSLGGSERTSQGSRGGWRMRGNDQFPMAKGKRNSHTRQLARLMMDAPLRGGVS